MVVRLAEVLDGCLGHPPAPSRQRPSHRLTAIRHHPYRHRHFTPPRSQKGSPPAAGSNPTLGVVPVDLLLLIALGAGWWLGSQQNCRQVIIDPGIQRLAP